MSTCSKPATLQQHQPNCNDSMSSVDSSDSNDNQTKSLLEYCIRTGMNKNIKRTPDKGQRQAQLLQTNHLRSNSNIIGPSSSQQHRIHMQNLEKDHQRGKREKNDELLLMECINTGMSKFGSGETQKIHKKSMNIIASQTNLRQVFSDNNMTSNQLNFPKNVQATSAAALGPCLPRDAITSLSAPNIVPDVEMKFNSSGYHEGTSEQENLPSRQLHQKQLLTQSQLIKPKTNQLTDSVIAQEVKKGKPIMITGCNEFETSFSSNVQSELQCDESNTSKDYSPNDHNTSDSNDSFPMEVAPIDYRNNDSLPLSISALKDKHKDPDLMMKSVERLTLDFVSTAEFLRTASNAAAESENTSLSLSLDTKRTKSNLASHSNNTWNNDTCPNDVSFPSVSLSAPQITSLTEPCDDQHTTIEEDLKPVVFQSQHAMEIYNLSQITPTDEMDCLSPVRTDKYEDDGDYVKTPQPCSSLGTETESATLTTTSKSSSAAGINFIVGGEVQSLNHVNQYFVGRSTIASHSPNLLNIAETSTAIALEANALAENLLNYEAHSLDLDNIRPPSCMESMNVSGYYETGAMQATKITPKHLPSGLVAKRALGAFSNTLHGSLESINSTYNLENIKPPSLMDELLDSMFSVASIQSEVVDNSLDIPVSLSNYETAANFNGNDSDENTITLRSCNEILPRDDDLNDAISYRSDYSFSSAESTPQKMSEKTMNVLNGGASRRTLTPKQKRKLVKDRFKTYTITDEHNDHLALIKTLPTIDNEDILQVEIEDGKTLSVRQEGCMNSDYDTHSIHYPMTVSIEKFEILLSFFIIILCFQFGFSTNFKIY